MDHKRLSSSRSGRATDALHNPFVNDERANYHGPIYGPDGGVYLPSNQVEYPLEASDLMHQDGLISADSLFHNLAFDVGNYPELQSNGTSGLGIHYVSEYRTPPLSSYVSNSVIETPTDGQVVFPLSPASATSESAKRTRSGRVVRSTTPHSVTSRVSRTSSSTAQRAKPARKRTSNTKAPRIDKPLSELTQHMADVPVRDMDAWVHRSEEERYKEVEKKNGYVSRPMNSFMLYRSAYAERTKQWCLQNNHQVVSAVSGESWPMEPPEIREKYNELARIERDNHAKAHPDYKFSPSKGGAVKRKAEYSSEDEESEQSDEDAEWRPRNRRRKVPNVAKPSTPNNRSTSKAATSLNRPYELQYITVPASTWQTPKDSQGISLDTSNNGPYYYSDLHMRSRAPMTSLESTETDPFDFSSTQITSIPNGFSEAYNDDVIPSDEPSSFSFNQHIDPMLAQFEHSPSFDGIPYFYGAGQDYVQPYSQFDDWMESAQFA